MFVFWVWKYVYFCLGSQYHRVCPILTLGYFLLMRELNFLAQSGDRFGQILFSHGVCSNRFSNSRMSSESLADLHLAREIAASFKVVLLL